MKVAVFQSQFASEALTHLLTRTQGAICQTGPDKIYPNSVIHLLDELLAIIPEHNLKKKKEEKTTTNGQRTVLVGSLLVERATKS